MKKSLRRDILNDKTLKVVLCQGLQGSGKSTWAKKQVGNGKTIRISLDDLRKMFNDTYWQENTNNRKNTEAFVQRIKNTLILEALDAGKNVIVDATHLKPQYITQVQELVGDKATVEIKSFMDVPIETCIKRDLARERSVGEKVIRDAYKTYLKANGLAQEILPIPYDSSLPDAIICDIDGTVAYNEWRSPFDTSHCDEDGIYETIVNLVMRDYQTTGAKLFFLSGREGHAEAATKRWLAKHYIKYDALFMRTIGDYRKDFIIKEEIYEREIKGKYNVLYVVDDRASVCKMWRSLGLTCLQTAEGDF